GYGANRAPRGNLMKSMLAAAVAALCLATSADAFQAVAVQGQAASERSTFVQIGRLLADPANGSVLSNKTLVIADGQVREILDGFVDGDGEVIDLRDSFVLPGLIDSHVHITSQ